MKKHTVSSLLLLGHLTLLGGCSAGQAGLDSAVNPTQEAGVEPKGRQMFAPEISTEPVKLFLIETNEGDGFINQSGKIVIEPKFSNAGHFSDGLAAVEVEKDGKKLWGFINHKGEFVIQPKYDSVDSFSDKLAFVRKGIDQELQQERIVIDQRGNEVFKLKKEWSRILLPNFSEGLAPISIKNDDDEEKIGFINTKGEMVIEPRFDSVRSFSNGFAFVEFQKDSETIEGFKEKVGRYIDKTGKLAFPQEYKDGTDFSEDHAIVSIPEKETYFIINRNGKSVKDGIYSTCIKDEGTLRFSEGLIPVQIVLPWQRKKPSNAMFNPCSFVNLEGNPAFKLNIKVEKAKPFSEGLAAVQIKPKNGDFYGKWGFIDKTGKIVIKPKFEEVSSFENGLAYVNKQGYIDQTGRFIWKR
jgi:WG containing repeat